MFTCSPAPDLRPRDRARAYRWPVHAGSAGTAQLDAGRPFGATASSDRSV